MTFSSSSTVPTVLFDTCVISAFVNSELKPEDATAVFQMAEMARRGQLSICGSTVTKEELSNIPPTYRSSHMKEYKMLSEIRGSNTTWLDTNPSSTAFGTIVQDPTFQTLRNILRDENDARLLFQAKMAGITNFVTVDQRSVLNKAADIAAQVGVNVYSPSQYLASTSRST